VRDLYSTAEGGTALLAWVPGFPSKPSTANEVQPAFEIGGVCLPIAGEVVCGDAWSVNRFPGGIRLLVADGLGHGTGASEAANEALNLAAAHTGDSASELINRIHAGLRATRGAAVAVADVDSRAGVVRYCGLGNITGSVTAPDAVRRQMVSHNGTAGLQARTVREFTYPWPANGLLILHSDGLATHWSLDRYPGLARRDTSLIAGVLFRDFARGRDDATIVAIREKPRLEEVHDVPSSPRG